MKFGKMGHVIFGCLALAFACAIAPAQTTQPAPAATLGEMRLRANQSMAKSDYGAALPILEKVALQLTDQPDELGPVMEQIRVCKRQMAAAKNATTKPAVVATVTTELRKPHAEVAKGQTLELTMKELGNFDYDVEKGGGIPEDVTKLEGVHFRTHGFMIPLDQAESISEFALVPSLFACCFGQPPQIQHTLIVHCPKGKAMSWFGDELVVDGTLHVREQKDGGFIVSIFDLDASSVKPAAQ